MKEQDWVEVFDNAMQNAMVYGTGFVRVAKTENGRLELSVVKPEDYQWLEPNEAVKEAQGRVYDLLLADDGQAWKEAERYLERARPDLAMRLREKR